jgi:tetratricopeptide (TPR) repeat protein
MNFLICLLLFYLLLFPLIVVHEFGHALFGTVAGMKIFAINLGYGKQLFETRIFGVSIRLNRVPFSGWTLAVPRHPTFIRIKYWLTVFGGPAMNLLLILISLYYLSSTRYGSHLWGLLVTFTVSNLWLLGFTLTPYKSKGSFIGSASDGYQLLHIPFADKRELMEFLGSSSRIEAYELQRVGRFSEAIIRYEELLAANPDDRVSRHDLAVAFLNTGKFEEALKLFSALADAGATQAERLGAYLKNNIAYTIAVSNQTDQLDLADSYSREGIQVGPRVPNFMGTRGAVLVRMGHIDEGVTYLNAAFKRHSDPNARAGCACFLAIAEGGKGKYEQAEMWLDVARTEFPKCSVIKQAELALANG